ncbi:DUF6193 family natural product biosynthesis protein [Streptomyces sp. NPDC051098]|uniref:DUF6193 family natural product biosynthesis protein n=1 Tax=Streptomyces sp. NPDC051098 TaxID=3155411 RepID=UPI0034324388
MAGQSDPVHRPACPAGHLRPDHRERDRQAPAPEQHPGQQRVPVGGYVYPQEDGRFWVRGPLGVGSLGEVDTLEEAFALVVGSLPEVSE